MVSILIFAALSAMPGGQLPEPTAGHPVLLPTEYVENRFAVTPITNSGQKLRLFTDSAGGHFLTSEIVDMLKLPTESHGSENGKPLRSVAYPSFKPEASIPPAIGSMLFVFDSKVMNGGLEGYDGMLGQQWFAGRVWTFDYPAKQLLWRAAGDLPKHEAAHEVKLGFQTTKAGVRRANFARIEVEVDGETLSFVLDTGATNLLSAEALKEINDGRPADRATSFLAEGIYNKWHIKHPEWRVVRAKSATGLEMIEVPRVTVAGFTVGPVWFSVQQDAAFHQYMAQWMDKPTEGALGGSLFKYFRMAVDWPNAVAVFEKP